MSHHSADHIRPTAIRPTAIRRTAIRRTAIRRTAIRPIAVRPTAIRPTAIRPTAIRPTAIRPTTIRPTTIRPTTFARRFGALALGVLAALAGPGAGAVAADEKAEKVVRQAVRIQGGQDAISAIGDVQLELEVTAHGEKTDAFKGTLFQLYRGPTHLAMVMRAYVKPDLIKVFDGSQGQFMRRGGARPLKMEARDLRQMRSALSRARLLLLPNLFVDGATFQLLRTRPGWFKVKWSASDSEPMTLHFDRNFLLKRAYFGGSGAASATKIEFDGFRLFDLRTGAVVTAGSGVRLPTSVEVYERAAGAKKYTLAATILLKRVGFGKKFTDGIFVDPRVVAKYIAPK